MTKSDARKIAEINAVLNDGPWTEVLKNSRDTLLEIVHILKDRKPMTVQTSLKEG